MFNNSGALVKQLISQAVTNGVYTLDLQAQPAGIYFLQVIEGRNVLRFKVIKQ